MNWNWLEVGDVGDIGTLKGELLLWVWSMLWEYVLTLKWEIISVQDVNVRFWTIFFL